MALNYHEFVKQHKDRISKVYEKNVLEHPNHGEIACYLISNGELNPEQGDTANIIYASSVCEVAEELGVEVINVDEARMTEIKAELDELEANKPPTLRGKPTPEWLRQSKTHAANRGAYEATLSKDEMKACQARGWYVKSPFRRPGNKKKEKKEKKQIIKLH